MIDKQVLQKHFSRNARNYDRYANVQKKMANELLNINSNMNSNMSALTSCTNHGCIDILDIGCGTGYLTELLLESYPNARITAVDIAPGMIEYAKEKFVDRNVEFLCLDIEEADINKKYDLIISNATFQWFNNLEETIEKLGKMLKNSGMLAFSTFGNLTFNELERSYQIASAKLETKIESPPTQKFLSPEAILRICKRKLISTSAERFEFSSTENIEQESFNTVRDFLDSLKKIGANNCNNHQKLNIALTREMLKTYEDMFKAEGQVKATYHCVFLSVKKTGFRSCTEC